MTIKTATYQELTKDELYRILQLRSEVFVVEQDCPYQDLDDMEYGVAAVREHFPDLPCLIHAQSYATGFYEKFGFKVSSEDFLEDGIPHREMILEI